MTQKVFFSFLFPMLPLPVTPLTPTLHTCTSLGPVSGMRQGTWLLCLAPSIIPVPLSDCPLCLCPSGSYLRTISMAHYLWGPAFTIVAFMVSVRDCDPTGAFCPRITVETGDGTAQSPSPLFSPASTNILWQVFPFERRSAAHHEAVSVGVTPSLLLQPNTLCPTRSSSRDGALGGHTVTAAIHDASAFSNGLLPWFPTNICTRPWAKKEAEEEEVSASTSFLAWGL